MIYLIKEDLVEVIQERLLDDSLQLDENILEGTEKKAIAFAVSYISGRYKANEIFGGTWWAEENGQPTTPIMRHPLLIFVLARFVVYWAVRRNAARKVPEDYKEIFKEAEKVLEKIQSGAQKLPGLPENTGEGEGSAKLMYGNTTKDEYFI